MFPATSNDYGVKYTPSDNLGPAVTVEELEFMGIRYIRLQWVDLINHVRYRVVPLGYFLKLMRSPRPSITVSKPSMGLVYSTLSPGFSVTGEYLFVPDLASLRRCTYTKDHASVMGWFQEKQPVVGRDGGNTIELDFCPRTVLRRVVENAKQTSGVEFLVGFETEFILLKSTSPMQPVNSHGWSHSSAMLAGSVEEKVVFEIADALQHSGIELQMYHSETAPGQYEMITGPLPPLRAADALVHTRETIYSIANKHGLRATLAPRPFVDKGGSSTHTHISVHSTQNSLSKSEAESAFLASLLAHLQALPLITMPIPASYKRMTDGLWTCGTYVCWGTDNREVPVRLCHASSRSSRNFEIRCVDGTSNPYLVLAAIIGVGHKGIRDGAILKMMDCLGPETAASMGEESRRAMGITQRMPLSWVEARKTFAQDDVIKEIFGDEMMSKYLSVNETLVRKLETELANRLVEIF